MQKRRQRSRQRTARHSHSDQRSFHQRRELREAVLLTLISGAFVVGGIWALIIGKFVLGLVCVLFFSAGLVLGVTWWLSALRPERDRRRAKARPVDKAFRVAAILGAALMGLACLGIFLAALTDGGGPDMFSDRYPRPYMLVVGGIGALFFGGGSLVVLVQGLLSWKERGRRKE